MNYKEMEQLEESNLSNINGGSILGGIAVAGGIVAAANEVYKFGQGFVNGWNNYK